MTYQQQYGGTACLQGFVEGYLVPVDITEGRPLLDELFLRTLNGTGLGSPRTQSETTLSKLRRAVQTVTMPPSTSDYVGPPAALRLDEGRAIEVDEGWLPVITADVPGVLVWDNSD